MRVNDVHKNLILETAEKHPALITNKVDGPNGRGELAKVWESLTNQLNCLGYGQRSTEDWKGTLSDWKSKTKIKGSKIQQHANRTGGGTPSPLTLTAIEERLLTLMGRSVFGDTEAMERGIKRVRPENSDIADAKDNANDNKGDELAGRPSTSKEGVEHIFIVQEGEDDSEILNQSFLNQSFSGSAISGVEMHCPTTPGREEINNEFVSAPKRRRLNEESEVRAMHNEVMGVMTSIATSLNKLTTTFAQFTEIVKMKFGI